MKRPKRLSAAFVKTVITPGRYGDGHGGYGLSLLVKTRAHGGVAKSWAQRIRIDGKPVNVGLGRYPIVTLAEARAKALENARAVHQGRDPRDRSRLPTFEQAAAEVIRLHEPTWRSGAASSSKVWRSSLERYVYPAIGRKLVSEVNSADVLGVIAPIWNTKRETARRVRGRISTVMRWAIAQRYRDDDPARDVAAALPKNGGAQEHHKALPYAEVGAALRTVRESGASPAAKLAFEFQVLTAARSGEVRLARWDEIDLPAATWTVPAERMKAGRAHRVPLSTRALQVLGDALKLSDGSGLLFPSPTGRGELSNNTLLKLLRELGIEAVPHGFRSSFRDWCSETGQRREVAEAALAHVVRDKVEAAYARSDLFELRRELMETWAMYVSTAGRRTTT